MKNINAKIIPVSELLKKAYGGTWKYLDKDRVWVNQDTPNEYVCYVSNCSCDDVCGCGSSMYLYGRGTPIRISYTLGDLIL